MSAPVQNNGNADDPGYYAPPRGRETAPAPPPRARAEDSAPTEPSAGDPNNAERVQEIPRPEARLSARLPRGLGGPNIPMPVLKPRAKRAAPPPPPAADATLAGQPPQPAEFEGGKPPRDLPLFVVPDLPSEPLFGRQSFRWFATVAVAAAVVAGGVTFVSLPENRVPNFNQEMGPAVRQLVASLSGSPQPMPMPRLIVEGRQTFANEALPLGVALKGASGSEIALLTGLVTGTRVSVGGPFGATGWRIPVRELDGALAYAPKDFVGVMDAAIDLRLPNDLLLDSQALRLEWIVPKQPEPRVRPERPQETKAETKATVGVRTLDAAEVDLFLKRGRDYLNMGDIISARLVLRRAANAGSAQAALAIGATFDPNMLAELGVVGFAPDPAQARIWYQRAAELGSADAPRHIDRLAKAGH